MSAFLNTLAVLCFASQRSFLQKTNEALEDEPYYSRSVDELIGKFHGCVVFSIVDLKKGVLDGNTSPRFKASNLHADRHWTDISGHGFQWEQLLPLMSFKRN